MTNEETLHHAFWGPCSFDGAFCFLIKLNFREFWEDNLKMDAMFAGCGASCFLKRIRFLTNEYTLCKNPLLTWYLRAKFCS